MVIKVNIFGQVFSYDITTYPSTTNIGAYCLNFPCYYCLLSLHSCRSETL